MRPTLRLRWLTLGLFLLAPITTSEAQRPATAPQPAGAGTLVGVVVDTLGRPVAGVSVFMDGRTREVVTRADGLFRFDEIKSDAVTIATRRAGFFPQSASVQIRAEGASVIVELVPRLTTLAPVVTEATPSGLSGVVSDSVLGPLAGVEVIALGKSRASTRTDAAGLFFLDIKPGQYMVRALAKDHVPQEMGVTVPPKGGRRIAVRMARGSDPYHARTAAYADELRERLARRSEVYSKVFTREDISKLNPPDVHSLAVHGAPMIIGQGCTVHINGGVSAVPLWSLDPSEIELMEVYAKTPTTSGGSIRPRGSTSIRGMGRIASQAQVKLPDRTAGLRETCPEGIIVWTAR
jgi:hypothetical protein